VEKIGRKKNGEMRILAIVYEKKRVHTSTQRFSGISAIYRGQEILDAYVCTQYGVPLFYSVNASQRLLPRPIKRSKFGSKRVPWYKISVGFYDDFAFEGWSPWKNAGLMC
jgi:hypothetical protein